METVIKWLVAAWVAALMLVLWSLRTRRDHIVWVVLGALAGVVVLAFAGAFD